MIRNILERLAEPALVAVRAEGSAWPRSLLSATLIPDKWMGLVESGDGRRRFVPAGEDPRPDRHDRLLLVRNRPITVPLSVEDVAASSGHAVSGRCELLLRWHARADDLAALGQTLLDRDELTLDALARAAAHGGGTAALQQFIRQREAARLVHEEQADEFLAVLREQLKRFLFSTGAVLERILTLKFTSPALERAEALQREAAAHVERIKARELVQQAALAATQRRLEGLSGIFEKLKAAAAGDDRLQWHDLLPALAPADRGRLLENLWRITPDQEVAAAIVVVAGQDCVWLDPLEPDRVLRRISLPETLGGLRSVTFSAVDRLLLIGAACGVWAVAEDEGRTRARYDVPGAELPPTGFNAATISRGRLFASHSQLGVWAWPLDSPGQAEALFQPIEGVPKTIRAATTTADGTLLFAADDVVHIVRPEDGVRDLSPKAPGVIQCLAVQEGIVYAGTTDGTLVQMDLKPSDGWTIVHRAYAAIESVIPRRWNDLVELVIPAGAAGICGVYALEGFVARLVQAPVSIRRVWACDDLLVGLSDYRDRLVVMNASAPERLGREVPVGRMLGHSVQDACIVTKQGEHEPPARSGEPGPPARNPATADPAPGPGTQGEPA